MSKLVSMLSAIAQNERYFPAFMSGTVKILHCIALIKALCFFLLAAQLQKKLEDEFRSALRRAV